MSKVVADAKEAIKDIEAGAVLTVGGFGLCGIPENCIQVLREKGVKNLTIVSNNCGIGIKGDYFGLGFLLIDRQIKKMIASYVGENDLFEELLLSGEMEVELVPQGSLAEKLRAGGAGIAAFYTPTGVGTMIAEGKEEREFDGKKFILEQAIHGDFGLVKAHLGDTNGNLIYRRTARNFNPECAMAGKITIAEVEKLVPAGELDPDHIHTPGIYVQRIFEGKDYVKRIERRTVQGG